MEKIKISVPEKIYDLLRRDAKDFKILKSSGEENLNALINLLVMNFYEAFSSDDAQLRENIRGALSGLPEKYEREIFPRIMSAIQKRDKGEDLGRSVFLSFKPTKVTEASVIYIENVLLKNESLSSFYRRMFVAYAQKTKNEREKIIHKHCYDLLVTAMKKGVQVCVSLLNGDVYNDASVFAIESARDELFNYALLFSNNKNRTVRLAKIKTVSLLTTEASIPEKERALFSRQVLLGAQYPIYSIDDEPIRVQLTPKGKGLFERIYLYRPVPISIEGDVYTFNCSAYQVLFYFQRFGAEALILSPKRQGIFMRNYYYYALKKYRTLYGKE